MFKHSFYLQYMWLNLLINGWVTVYDAGCLVFFCVFKSNQSVSNILHPLDTAPAIYNRGECISLIFSSTLNQFLLKFTPPPQIKKKS